MKAAVMQPYLFPYLGYFQLMAAADLFIFLDDVAYINRGWINRNRIMVNGKEHLFTVPLKDASQNKFIREIETDISDQWKKKFLRTVEMAYSKAPHFKTVFALIEEILNSGIRNLSEFIFHSFKRLAEYLGIKTKLVPSSAVYSCGDKKAQEKIICIAAAAGADTYINPPGGRDLYDAGLFLEKKIELRFLSPVLPAYRQGSAAFIPGLSIIDVMMHNSPEQITEWLNAASIVQ